MNVVHLRGAGLRLAVSAPAAARGAGVGAGTGAGAPPTQVVADLVHVGPEGAAKGAAAGEPCPDAGEENAEEPLPTFDVITPCHCEGGAAKLCNSEHAVDRMVAAVCAMGVLARAELGTLEAGLQREHGGLSVEQITKKYQKGKLTGKRLGERIKEFSAAQEKWEVAAAWAALGAGLDSYLGAETLSLEQLFYTRKNAKRRRRDAFGAEELALLPEGTPELRLGRCALVGSSGNMNGKRQGTEIDAHDTVMRINNAPVTAEYAPDVGAKTTVRVLNKKWSQVYGHSRPDLLKMDSSGEAVMVVGTRVDVRDFAALARGAAKLSGEAGAGTRYSALYMNPKAVRQGWDLLSALRTALGEATGREYPGRNAITTGALGLFLLLRGCDSIDAYGFSLESCVPCSHPFHYFKKFIDSDKSTGQAHPSHSFRLEGALMQALHVSGRVCLHPPLAGVPCGKPEALTALTGGGAEAEVAGRG